MEREKEKYKVLLFTNKKSTPPIYKALSKYKDDFSYGIVRETDALTKEFKIPKVPSLGLVTGRYDYQIDWYDGDLTLNKIKDFLRLYTGGKRKVSKSGQIKLVELNQKSMNSGL